MKMDINKKSILTICASMSLLFLGEAVWASEGVPKPKKAVSTSPKQDVKKATTTTQDSTSSKDKYLELRKDATISEGMFSVVKQKDDYYFDIPTQLLGRDLLVVNKLQRVPKELNEAGVNKGINYENKMIRLEWDKQKKAILVRESRPLPSSPQGEAIHKAVADNYISPLIASLKVEGVRADSSRLMIKVNDLYNGSETSLNNVFDNINLGTSAIKDLSRIQQIKSFANNVVGYSELTTKVREGNTSVNVTVELSSSIMLLPERVWAGRPVSPRVGYFTVSRLVYSDKQHKVETQELITRWRLEPREEDREAYLRGELVEPKKPIIFYIDDSTPKVWRKYMKAGIEAWQSAFERAGFKHAIQAREIADSIVDKDDINYSVLTYVASEKKNAMGPSLTDPRSGEILEADIIWWHNVMTMLREWIMVQLGATQREAQQVEIPDDLMGKAIQFVACHEVGHSLGLRHNMIASNAFSVDSLRSPSFTDRVQATAASIMDYARFNYVAQPSDGVHAVTPGIGEYDKFAIEYGYRWYGDAEGTDSKPLGDLLKRYTGKLYRYSEAQDSRDAVDPRALTEDLGDDAIEASQLGIANLKRIIPEVIKRTTTGASGQTYEDASELYYGIIYQWNNYLYHVLANVGGIYIENTSVGDGQQTYTFVPRERQRSATRFLINEVFTYPEWLFSPEVAKYTYLRRSTPNGVVENAPSQVLQNTQSYLLWDMLGNYRLMRMMEAENQLGARRVYTAVEMLDDLIEAIFRKRPNPTVRDRSLQKNMVDALLTASAEVESVKVNKKLMENTLPMALEHGLDWCDAHSLQAGPRKLNFYGSQLERISDAISVKRGALLRLSAFMRKQVLNGAIDRAVLDHYKDLILRINTALGLKVTEEDIIYR